MTMNEAVTAADFDHHSPEFREAPYETFARMRSQCPVQRSNLYGGFWSLLDYQSVFDAARDDGLFGSFPSIGVPPAPVQFPVPPIETDPPLTQKLRQITIGHFSPGAVERLRPRARQMVTAMINEFIERGECDIVSELTNPLPAKLALHMLGFDESKYMQWVNWVHAFVHDKTHDPEKAGIATMELMAEITRHVQERRSSGELGDDLFGAILGGRIDDVPLDDVQINMYTLMIMLGGMDTTSGLTGNSLLCMIERPELRQTLIEHPDLLRDATEEFLRHSTPTLGLGRNLRADTGVHGQSLKAGDKAVLMWAAANRDPAMFEDPDLVDFNRPNSKRHVAFGVGVHRCLGSSLARMMFQEMMSQILIRLPDFELNGTPVRFADAGEVYALRHLPIKFTPGARATADAGSPS